MFISIRTVLLITTTIYHAIASILEDQKPPPGKLVSVGQHKLHYCLQGKKEHAEQPTVILEHSLGGIEGYLLIEQLAKFTRVLIYDRAGYGWSEHSPHPRTSDHIVQELDILLQKAEIEPPYILIGDSFGSYNMRLYAHIYPQKISGIVLSDGLHEQEMLNLPFLVKALVLFFISGFFMSTIGSFLGIVRVLENLGVFELIKPELRKHPPEQVKRAKRSFCRPKHWITMSREMFNLEKSATQVSLVKSLGSIPIINIKANSFFHQSWWTSLIPLTIINRMRDRIQQNLCQLSLNNTQIEAHQSSHFVWIDQPEVIIEAVQILLDSLEQSTIDNF